jgi:hypothetical protein
MQGECTAGRCVVGVRQGVAEHGEDHVCFELGLEALWLFSQIQIQIGKRQSD